MASGAEISNNNVAAVVERLVKKREDIQKRASEYVDPKRVVPPSRRNSEAAQAATDHYNRAVGLLDIVKAKNPYDVCVHQLIESLRANRDFAENKQHALQNYWKRIFTWDPTEWTVFGLYKNGYALEVHVEAAQDYRECLRQLDGMDLRVRVSDAPASSKLQLLFANTGGSEGSVEKTVTTGSGFKATLALDTELLNEVYTKAEASKDLQVAKISAEVRGKFSRKLKFASNYETHKTEAVSETIHVGLKKPCFIYQMQTRVQLTTNGHVTVYGGYFITNRDIYNEVPMAQRAVRLAVALIATHGLCFLAGALGMKALFREWHEWLI